MDEGPGLSGVAVGAATSERPPFVNPMDSPQWKPLSEEAFVSCHAFQPIDSVFGSLPCILRREFGLSQYELRRAFREIGRISIPGQ